MGSFRIVTGSGYGRHEISSASALNQEFSKLWKAAAQAQAAAPKVQTKKATTGHSSGNITKLYDRLWNDAVRKANKWARETAAEMRANVPYDTGNLSESIHVLEDQCYRNKASGQILMVVGADLDPAGGRGKLFAPPVRKQSPKYGKKHAPWKGYRVMPRYPNDYSFKYIGEGMERRFQAISKKNAKKIMGK